MSYWIENEGGQLAIMSPHGRIMALCGDANVESAGEDAEEVVGALNLQARVLALCTRWAAEAAKIAARNPQAHTEDDGYAKPEHNHEVGWGDALEHVVEELRSVLGAKPTEEVTESDG